MNKDGSTTNAHRHLADNHDFVVKRFAALAKENAPDASFEKAVSDAAISWQQSSAAGTKVKQRTLPALTGTPIQVRRSNMIDAKQRLAIMNCRREVAAILYAASTSQSVSHLASPQFHGFVSAIADVRMPTSRSPFYDRMVDVAAAVRVAFLEQTSSVAAGNICFDGWKSLTNKDVLGVTVDITTADFRRLTIPLGLIDMKDLPADAETTAAMLLHIINRSGASRILDDKFLCYTFMADGASVVQLAAVRVNGDALKCVAHTISRAMKTLLADSSLKASPVVAQLLDGIRIIFRFVANHASARLAIEQAQGDILGRAEDRLLVVSTPKDIRWHVYQWCVTQFLKLAPALFGFCEQHGTDELKAASNFVKDRIHVLDDVSKVLTAVRVTSRVLEASDFPTGSSAPRRLWSLFNTLQEMSVNRPQSDPLDPDAAAANDLPPRIVELRPDEILRTPTGRSFAAECATEISRRFRHLWTRVDDDALALLPDMDDAAGRKRRNRAMQAKVFHMAALVDVNEAELPYIQDIPEGETRSEYFTRLYQYFAHDAVRVVEADQTIVEIMIASVHREMIGVHGRGLLPPHQSLSFWRDLDQHPHLSVMFKNYGRLLLPFVRLLLAVPATSAVAERLFKAAQRKQSGGVRQYIARLENEVLIDYYVASKIKHASDDDDFDANHAASFEEQSNAFANAVDDIMMAIQATGRIPGIKNP